MNKSKEYILLYLYVCDRDDPKWMNYLVSFKSVNIPIKDIAPGHHNGLAFQIVLNITSIRKAVQIVKKINDVLGVETLAVIDKIQFDSNDNISTKYNEKLIKAGTFFDRKVSEQKRGIFYRDL